MALLMIVPLALMGCGDEGGKPQGAGKLEEVAFAAPAPDDSILVEQAKALVDSAAGQPLLKAQQQSGKPVEVKITKADLDGEGGEDYIMRFENAALCTDGGCPVGVFFGGGEPPYRLRLINYSTEAKIWISDERVNGHAVLYSQLKPDYRFRWEWQQTLDADSYDKIYQALTPAAGATNR